MGSQNDFDPPTETGSKTGGAPKTPKWDPRTVLAHSGSLRIEARKKKIEANMEHFKEFERESKTKRFSQQGLNKEAGATRARDFTCTRL